MQYRLIEIMHHALPYSLRRHHQFPRLEFRVFSSNSKHELTLPSLPTFKLLTNPIYELQLTEAVKSTQ